MKQFKNKRKNKPTLMTDIKKPVWEKRWDWFYFLKRQLLVTRKLLNVTKIQKVIGDRLRVLSDKLKVIHYIRKYINY